MEPGYHEIEQGTGPPEVPPPDLAGVDAHRELVYRSYETYLRNQLLELDETRASKWKHDYSGEQAYLASIAPMRDRFKAMFGWWVEPAQREPVSIRDEEMLYEEDDFVVRRYYFEIFSGLESYAVEVVPRSSGPRPGLLIQHGYGGTPELACGFGKTANGEDYSYRSMGLRAVRRGYHVIAVYHPSGYGVLSEEMLDQALPDFPQYGYTYGQNRLHRLAVMAGGRTLLGLDMMAASRGVELLVSRADVDRSRGGMYGLSQGGTTRLYLASMDERIRASVASASFSCRILQMIGPSRAGSYLDSPEEDKFFPDLIPLFSDGEVASLIAPRALGVEAGERDTSVDFEKAWYEFQRARVHFEKLGIPDRCEFIAHCEGHIPATARAFAFLAEQLM